MLRVPGGPLYADLAPLFAAAEQAAETSRGAVLPAAGAVLELTDADLLSISNLGHTTLKEIREYTEEYRCLLPASPAVEARATQWPRWMYDAGGQL